jgi:putative PIN family toxin of toxin-antitoxin system
MRKFIIDTSVYISFSRYNKISRLIQAIIKGNLRVFTNEQLVKELERNIPLTLKVGDVPPELIIETIKAATFYFETEQLFSGCPDPKDNFLFDLALQTGSELIVSEEKILLNWAESPVPVHNILWFKEQFFKDIPL